MGSLGITPVVPYSPCAYRCSYYCVELPVPDESIADPLITVFRLLAKRDTDDARQAAHYQTGSTLRISNSPLHLHYRAVR